MKKYNEYKSIFRDYKLTDLLTLRIGNKKGAGDNSSVYTLINYTLNPYGIYLWGGWAGLEGVELRHCVLDKNFPEENFPILVQMYGWDNSDIYICLERNDWCEYGFYFNTESLKIRLTEMRWGAVKKDRFFNSFAEFWAERKTVKKKYKRMLPEEDKTEK